MGRQYLTLPQLTWNGINTDKILVNDWLAEDGVLEVFSVLGALFLLVNLSLELPCWIFVLTMNPGVLLDHPAVDLRKENQEQAWQDGVVAEVYER